MLLKHVKKNEYRLEALARKLFPHQASICHNLLRHKSVIIQPELLEANGITVHRLRFQKNIARTMIEIT